MTQQIDPKTARTIARIRRIDARTEREMVGASDEQIIEWIDTWPVADMLANPSAYTDKPTRAWRRITRLAVKVQNRPE